MATMFLVKKDTNEIDQYTLTDRGVLVNETAGCLVLKEGQSIEDVYNFFSFYMRATILEEVTL